MFHFRTGDIGFVNYFNYTIFVPMHSLVMAPLCSLLSAGPKVSLYNSKSLTLQPL